MSPQVDPPMIAQLRSSISPGRLVDLMLESLGVGAADPHFLELRRCLDAGVDCLAEELGDPPSLSRAQALRIAAGLFAGLASLAEAA